MSNLCLLKQPSTKLSVRSRRNFAKVSFQVVGGPGGAFLYISLDPGRTWTRQKLPSNVAQFSSVAIEPVDPGIVYVGTYGAGVLTVIVRGH
jgi:hypothetical protein